MTTKKTAAAVALTGPTFTHPDGTVHVGVWPSIEVLAPIHDEWAALLAQTNLVPVAACARRACEALQLPADAVLALPPGELIRAVSGFFNQMWEKPVT